MTSVFWSESLTASACPMTTSAPTPVEIASTTPTRTPKKKERTTGETRRRGSGGRRAPTCFEAFGAVDRTIGARQERHLSGLAAVAAGDVVHAGGARRAPFRLRLRAVLRATPWLVLQALLLVELLLA